ncbi:MAG: acyl-CoA dehydrogenase family protein [Sneathiella sp.]
MTITAKKEAETLKRVEEFAKTEIAPNRQSLITSQEFPKALWDAFAKSGLAGLSVPKEFGGEGASYHTVAKAAKILSQTGGVPGATMVFSAHWLMTKIHIVNDANNEIRQTLLPLLSRGDATLSVAISEPGAGAHPKHLTTTARREGGDFILNGEKTYLTNAPLADYFVTLAITDEAHGKKSFSAILIPTSAPGFQRTDGVKIDFLHPCPHGGIRLEECRVPLQNLIGVEGDAFERTSLRMRAIEDAAGALSHVGSMQCLIQQIAIQATIKQATAIGEITTQLQALEVLANQLAQLADQTEDNVQPLLEMQLGFKQFSHLCSEALEKLVKETSLSSKIETDLLARDIGKLHNIARSAHAARHTKIGKAYIQKTSRSE